MIVIYSLFLLQKVHFIDQTEEEALMWSIAEIACLLFRDETRIVADKV